MCIRDRVEVIKELNPLLQILIPPIKALLVPIKALITWVQALVAGFVSVIQFWERIIDALSNLGGGGIDIGAQLGFQHGGVAPGNREIIVGEAGPEILRTPAGGATVIPNNEIGGGIVVYVYDGTGRKIDQSMSDLRVEIIDRANRFSQFSAVAV